MTVREWCELNRVSESTMYCWMSVFLDGRELDGSVIDQVEQAYQYVPFKTDIGANVDWLVRRPALAAKASTQEVT